MVPLLDITLKKPQTFNWSLSAATLSPTQVMMYSCTLGNVFYKDYCIMGNFLHKKCFILRNIF